MGETKQNIDMVNQTERPAENVTPGAGPEIAADPRQMIAACNELGAMYRETGQYSLSLEGVQNPKSPHTITQSFFVILLCSGKFFIPSLPHSPWQSPVTKIISPLLSSANHAKHSYYIILS